MSLPAFIRNGGSFVSGTLYEVFQKSEGYKDKDGLWVKDPHWVVDVKCTKVIRGKQREISQFVYLSADQVNRKVHEKLQQLENTLVVFTVFSGSFQRFMLDDDTPVNLSEVA